MLRDITLYGKLPVDDLIQELADVSAALASRLRELGGIKADYNRDWYPIYFRSPGNSVAAKEREANYECMELINEMALVEQDIAALTVAKNCLTVILSYGRHA